MRYLFYATDYFTNLGEFDFSQEHYHALLRRCFQYCWCFSLEFNDEDTQFARELKDWQIENPGFSYQGEGQPENRRYYRACPASATFLMHIANSFFDFDYYRNNKYPDDIIFYRKDGTVFLDVIAHEGECNLYPLPGEEVDDVLAFGHWIKMIGGSAFEAGEACEPAKEHQLPIPVDQRVFSDPVYNLIRAIQRMPERYIGGKSLFALEQYVDGFRMGMVYARPNVVEHLHSYTPVWYISFQLYLLGQCNAMTDVKMSEAIRRAGYTDENGFDKFFELLEQFIDYMKKFGME